MTTTDEDQITVSKSKLATMQRGYETRIARQVKIISNQRAQITELNNLVSELEQHIRMLTTVSSGSVPAEFQLRSDPSLPDPAEEAEIATVPSNFADDGEERPQRAL